MDGWLTEWKLSKKGTEESNMNEWTNGSRVSTEESTVRKFKMKSENGQANKLMDMVHWIS